MQADKDRVLELLLDEGFQLWISGEASEGDRDFWEAWLKERPQNRKLYEEAVRLWQAARFEGAAMPDVDAELRRLENRIDIEESRKEMRAAPVAKLPARDRSRRSSFGPWPSRIMYALAAAIIFALFFSPELRQHLFAPQQNMRVVETKNAERKQLSFANGTRIILNANSRLSYSDKWTPETGIHFDLHGEAYFHVQPLPAGSRQSFSITTVDGEIRVVGTRFAIYERGLGTRVAVEKGIVEVVTRSSAQAPRPEERASTRLTKNEILKFAAGDSVLQPQKANVAPYITWWQDRFVLDQTPFSEIIARLQETYGISVRVTQPDLLSRTLSGSIENRRFEIVVQAVANALRIPVRFQGQIVIFGEEPM